MEEFLVIVYNLIELLQPIISSHTAWAVGVVLALMEAIKNLDPKNKLKGWYLIIGAGVSILFGVGLTLVESLVWWTAIIQSALIYIAEIGLDIGFLKPIIKSIKKVKKIKK